MTPFAVLQAKRIGEAHGLRVVRVQERRDPAVPGDFVDAWVVYRGDCRLGRRRDPAQLLRFVRTLIPTPERIHAPA